MSSSLPEMGQPETSNEPVAEVTINDGNLGQAPVTGEPAENPAWAEYLQEIPDAFHPQVKEAFKRWDQGIGSQFQKKAQEYNSQLEKYRQFDPLLERGLTAQHISAAQAIINELSTNPRGLYERLGQHLGITPEQAQDLVEGEEDGEEEENDDPRIAQLTERLQQTEAFLQQQHERQMQEQADVQVSKEIDQVKTKYNLNDKEMHEVLVTAAYLVNRNPNITLEQAFQNWDTRRRELYAQSPNVNAPSVVPVNGGDPTAPSKSYADMSEDEFKDDLLNALKQLNS